MSDDVPPSADALRARVDDSLAAAHVHAARLDADAWAFARGESRGLLMLGNHDESADDAVVVARVPLMRAPTERAGAFSRRLLELNVSLAGLVAFALDEDVAFVIGARLLAEVDDAAIASLAQTAAGAADAFRERLLDEFGRDLALE